MVQRHPRSPAFPSAYVFPGGTLRDDDLHLVPADRLGLARALSERSDTPVDVPRASALYACAMRELFEEAGVLLVRDHSGALLGVDDQDPRLQERLQSTRLALQARELAIADMLAEHAWQPAFDLLIPFSHWVTPRPLGVRFDTRFFIARLPPRQSALHDTLESSEGLWLRPRRALDDDYLILYPTAQHLGRLLAFHTVDDLLAFARVKAIRSVSPELVESSSGVSPVIPTELIDAW